VGGVFGAMQALVVATGVITKKFHTNSVKALTFSASAIAFVMAGPLAAQD